jgi:hypothetical protein
MAMAYLTEASASQGSVCAPLATAGACYADQANARLRREGGPSMTIETPASKVVTAAVMDCPPVSALRAVSLAVA